MAFPPLSEYAEWLIGIARRIGLGGGDAGATGYVEINAWCRSGIDLTLWERESVRAMSVCFCGALNQYRRERDADDDMPPPWMPEGRRELLEQQLAQFAEFEKRKR